MPSLIPHIATVVFTVFRQQENIKTETLAGEESDFPKQGITIVNTVCNEGRSADRESWQPIYKNKKNSSNDGKQELYEGVSDYLVKRRYGFVIANSKFFPCNSIASYILPFWFVNKILDH